MTLSSHLIQLIGTLWALSSLIPQMIGPEGEQLYVFLPGLFLVELE
ncbi:hypothetical protein SOVF_013770 [Spinacia oleracea]|nr:hypothetical protein SOVF_013770 [Spinacia oleracea]